MLKFIVDSDHAHMRLDKLLATIESDYSRTYWKHAIEQKNILINNQVGHATALLKPGDIVQYTKPIKQADLVAQMLNHSPQNSLDCIYEDDNVVVVNKPAGLITHPAHANTEDSLVHRLIARDATIQSVVWDHHNPTSLMRPGIVHRLDKDTSGVLIVAKTNNALHFLAKQIQQKQMVKHYQTLLFGWLEETEQTIHTDLNRDKQDRRKMAVYPAGEGRDATTVLRITQLLTTLKGARATLVDAQPITGRTHQIRIHTSSIHHPVLGDAVYGSHESVLLSQQLGLTRQFLHASTLTILLPHHTKPTTFEAPLPNDLANVLHQLHEIEG